LTLFSARCYSELHKAEVAQLVEQSIRNRQVSGSSPDFGSKCPVPNQLNWFPADGYETLAIGTVRVSVQIPVQGHANESCALHPVPEL
jgi:hypothetical protein